MSRCTICGAANPGTLGFCSFHVNNEIEWHVANRIFCDWLHRNIDPPVLPTDPYDDYVNGLIDFDTYMERSPRVWRVPSQS